MCLPCSSCACDLFGTVATPAGAFLACAFCGALKELDALPVQFPATMLRPETGLEIYERTKVLGLDSNRLRNRVVALDSFRAVRTCEQSTPYLTFLR